MNLLSRIAVDSPSPKEYLMKTLLLGMVAAAAILGATSASAEYREVRIVRDWDHWHHPPWFKAFCPVARLSRHHRAPLPA
jgi:hypothetical protein